MRRLLMMISVVVVVAACAKKETPPADTAVAVAPPMAPAPAPAVTEADIAGTWKGTSSPMGSDSVIAKWTQVCAAGTCKGTREGSKVTIIAAYTLAGDSSVGVSQPYSEPSMKGVKLIDTWVAHIHGDSATGTGAGKLASKPDSVVNRYHFAGTRTH
jgi:hypothetical protein